MEKETYNIDDILSEVKKRKQEREDSAPSFDIKTKKNGELPVEKPKEDKIPEDNHEQSENDQVFDNLYVRSEDGIVDSSIEEAEKKARDNAVITEKPAEEKEEAAAEQSTGDVKEPVPAKQQEEMQEAFKGGENGFVDLLSFADNSELSAEPQKTEKVKFFKTKKGKIIRNVIVGLLIVILIVGAGAGFYVYRALNAVSDDDNNASKTEQRYTAMDKLVENFPEINETGADNLSSLQDMIKAWYYNGAPCSSSHVLNVLLVGEDTRGDEILEEDTRADAAIIVSINTDTKAITLTSVLRDTYAYWENVPGDETTGEFGKINGAMGGGIGNYINCIEKLYKIDIDDYVIVNFDSFEGIVDQLGGVTLELTSAEINEINNHQDRYGNVTIEKTFEGSSGEIKLTGKQALAYCRIRKLDSDNMRADRQKTCLTEIFNSVRDGNSVTLLKVVNKLLPYVKTGFSTNEIISISKYALSQGWLSYDIRMTSVPNARINEKGAGGIYYGAWHWKADFPQDANYLQTLLYGKSSITLAEKRVDILRCDLYGFYAESLVPCYAVINNNSYGEATTYEVSTEEDTQTSN